MRRWGMGISRAKFTLVELMTVVAIFMVLAAIAIPMLQDYSLKAKYAEVYPNLESIVDAGLAYQMATDNTTAFIDSSTFCGNLSGNLGQRAPWTCLAGHEVGWQAIGWEPDGEVYGRYVFDTTGEHVGLRCNITGVSGLSSHATDNNVRAIFAHATTDIDRGFGDLESRCCEAGVGNFYPYRRKGRCGNNHESTY